MDDGKAVTTVARSGEGKESKAGWIRGGSAMVRSVSKKNRTRCQPKGSRDQEGCIASGSQVSLAARSVCDLRKPIQIDSQQRARASTVT